MKTPNRLLAISGLNSHKEVLRVLSAIVALLHVWSFAPIGTWAQSTPVSPSGIHVSESALGDVVGDGVLDIRDLLRLRDIAYGVGEAPTAEEQQEGDLDQDGLVGPEDVEILGRVLIEIDPVTYQLSDLGGELENDGVTMTFSDRDVEADVLIGLENVSPAQIEELTGVDFVALARDSTYFMKGWQLSGDLENISYPPQMDITLDELPPCELDGSNLLMAARKNPLGDPNLVMVAELLVTSSNSLSCPPPPYPVIGGEQLSSSYEPGDILDISATQLSRMLNGNNVIFEMDNIEPFVATPIGFIPENYGSFEEVTGLRVMVPPLPPGYASVGIYHTGSGLLSNALTVAIAPAHFPVGDPASLITEMFALLDEKIASWPDSVAVAPYPVNTIYEQTVQFMVIRDFMASVLPVFLDDTYVDGNLVAAMIENSGVLAELNLAKDIGWESSYSSDMRSVAQSEKFGGVWWSGAGVALGVVGSVLSCSPPSLLTGVGVGSCFVTLAATQMATINFVADLAEEYGNKDVTTNGIPNYWGGTGLISHMVGQKALDPSYNPRPYPNTCMNIWIHNTVVNGLCGGPAPPCPSGECCDECCQLPPPPCPSSNARQPAIQATALSPLSSVNDLEVLVSRSQAFLSPLRGAIVTPVNGGRASIVGVVDNSGAFAIPGLVPGQEIHFSVYDPKTGLYDPDAGHATSPNIVEMGARFSVYLNFQPDSEDLIFGLDHGETFESRVSLDQQRNEFFYYNGTEGNVLSFGFCANYPLKIVVESPSGVLLIDELDTTGTLDLNMPFAEVGEYRILVALGSSGLESDFILGIYDRGLYPLQSIGCSPRGDLVSAWSPHDLFGDVVVAAGDTLYLGSGQTIVFPAGKTLKADGVFLGAGTDEHPILLQPESN